MLSARRYHGLSLLVLHDGFEVILVFILTFTSIDVIPEFMNE